MGVKATSHLSPGGGHLSTYCVSSYSCLAGYLGDRLGDHLVILSSFCWSPWQSPYYHFSVIPFNFKGAWKNLRLVGKVDAEVYMCNFQNLLILHMQAFTN